MSKPLKFGKGLTGKVYAFRAWKHEGNRVVATGKREDITDEFRRELNNQLREWVDEGVLEVTDTGASILNDFFGLEARSSTGLERLTSNQEVASSSLAEPAKEGV